MKITAYILVIGMVMIGLNRFMEVMTYSEPQSELACEMDCCHSHADCDPEEEPGEDHSCPPGCDCSCCFHLVAIDYQFITSSELAKQPVHYGIYSENYFFHFSNDIFQPPRLG